MSSSTLNIRLKNNGAYWRAVWTDSRGKQRGRGLGARNKVSENEARLALANLHAQIINNPSMRGVGKTPSLEEHIDRYRTGIKHLALGTQALHRTTSHYLIRYFLKGRLIDTITKPDATDWRNWLAGKGIAEATVCCHVRNAKTMFNLAVEEETLQKNPFGHLVGTAPEPDKEWRELNEEDIDKLIAAAISPAWKALIGLCAYAGLRRGEALRIEWTDVKWDLNRLIVRNHTGAVSSKNKRREVLLDKKLTGILLDVFDKWTGTDRVVNLSPTVHTVADRIMTRTIIRAGLTPWDSPFHTLRKFRDTTWKQVYPEYVVDAWLGHSMEVSRRHYLKVPESIYAGTITPASKPSTENHS